MGKFIHAADIHLDSPLRGLQRYEGAPEHVRHVTRRAFDNLIRLALEEHVDFLLIAVTCTTVIGATTTPAFILLPACSSCERREFRCCWCGAIHDAANSMTLQLRLPDNVRELSYRAPETVVLDRIGAAVHGQGFAEPAVTENIARTYPDPVPGYLNIGLLHTALDGREGHQPYAPCTAAELVNKGYDYWALGHVHRRQVVHSGSPWVVFSGNLQGRHANEPGAKGCTVVSFADGRITGVSERQVDVLRWARCVVDCSGAHTPSDVLDEVRRLTYRELEQAQGRPVVFRFELAGPSPAHAKLVRDPEKWVNEIRAAVLDAGSGSGWVEKVQFNTTNPGSFQNSLPAGLPQGFMAQYFAGLEQDEGLLAQIRQEFRELKSKLPYQLFAEYPGLDLDDPAALQAILAAAQRAVEPRLVGEEGALDED